MRIVGVVSLIFGVVLVVVGLLVLAMEREKPWMLGVVVQGAVTLLIGGYTIQAAGAFSRIVNERGTAISYLMGALAALRNLYWFQVVVLIIAVGLVGLSVALSLPR